jgi:hypothetical protein
MLYYRSFFIAAIGWRQPACSNLLPQHLAFYGSFVKRASWWGERHLLLIDATDKIREKLFSERIGHHRLPILSRQELI